MDTKKLRQKILDLAIRGKLVPQDPNDEPASVLLERIKAEKERLIKEGKIKKSKKSAKTSDTPHYQNVPFEIPDNWVWTTLEEISNYGDCYNVSVTDIADNEWILELEDLEKDTASIIQKLSKKERNIKGVRHKFKKGDVLYSKLRTYLNKVLVAPKAGYCTTEIIPFNSYCDISTHYLCHVLRSAYFLDYTQQCGYGVKMPRLSTNDACKGMVPLPPLSEQQRIVMEIDKWLALIDQIEQGKADLQNTIKQTKSKILDLAIHGKLVPQDPNDEPAIKLLKRINPDFTPCDNGHYAQLPDGWCAVALKDLCENINGLWKGKKEPFVNVGVIRNANFTKDFKLDYSNIEYIDVEQRTFAKRHLENGDLIVEKSGGSDNNPVGRTILYEGKSGVFSFSNFTMVLRIRYNDTVLSKYLYYCILAKYQTGAMRLMQTQTTGLHNLILNKFLLMSICLPPLYEQRRIIDQIETFFTTLNLIMESL
ncbi:restriction endonuclease subunit S [Bacteroides stercoris]|jgi:type I restriction enzyme S subunit|uniref:Restriction endonuclease subunit S n=2 Tax=Bacteroides TaxID=816 RepID=A0A5D3EA77_9BACE|nr:MULTISPECIES: restriction endonuclease subunit S [Bacteroides]KAB5260420.1 restriction endonuclease subunit S [Bacteroides stercoris]KAB5278586.1 restriction endonuclease subunit S [Bacteroides stercoris]KAB5279951.1 restriction endonuclease subunit S [Bacteroides stercoris]KAB5283770.1 restriction endonuclease subunit S [Bacteroides stercoris]MDC2283328.1 restriction endonuclease subunit S [Bacteroides stercoris]